MPKLPKRPQLPKLPRLAKLPRLKDSLYAQKMLERVRELRERDAFEPAPVSHGIVGNQISAAKALATTLREHTTTRRALLVFGLVLVLVAAVSLCMPYQDVDTLTGGGTIYSPLQVLECYQLWFELHIMPLFDPSLNNLAAAKQSTFDASHDFRLYQNVINRAEVTVIVAACGIMLALSGLLFQSSFRNPLATPSMLGVSEGVMLGCIIFIFLGNSNIGSNPELYILLVYCGGAVAVAVVLFLSRGVSGAKRYNIFDMLLLGTVITQLLGGINQFIQNFVMDVATFNQFFLVTQAGRAVGMPLVRTIVIVVFIVTMVPALILRFRLNLVSFHNDEVRMMGVRPGLLRGAALVLGSIMQLAAIATIGQIAMLSLVVPILVRFLLPSDFRNQFIGNCLIGTIVLLLCVILQHFIVIGIMAVPVGTIVSVFIVPFFIWALAFGRGRWG